MAKDIKNIVAKLSEKSTGESTKKLNDFLLVVHKDKYNEFKLILLEYIQTNNLYNLYDIFNADDQNFPRKNDSAGFILCTEFLKNIFEREQIYKKCPESLKVSILKKGRRPNTDRTFAASETTKKMFHPTDAVNDTYLDLLFSYIIFTGGNILETFYTRNYFFYDFVDLLYKYKKEFLNFKIQS